MLGATWAATTDPRRATTDEVAGGAEDQDRRGDLGAWGHVRVGRGQVRSRSSTHLGLAAAVCRCANPRSARQRSRSSLNTRLPLADDRGGRSRPGSRTEAVQYDVPIINASMKSIQKAMLGQVFLVSSSKYLAISAANTMQDQTIFRRRLSFANANFSARATKQ